MVLALIKHIEKIHIYRSIMPISAAEKTRAYRARMSTEKKEQMRKKNAEQQKRSRAKWSNSRRELEAKKKCRENDKKSDAHENEKRVPMNQASPSIASGSAHAFGKALKKNFLMFSKMREQNHKLYLEFF